jgi:hypothetical protein
MAYGSRNDIHLFRAETNSVERLTFNGETVWNLHPLFTSSTEVAFLTGARGASVAPSGQMALMKMGIDGDPPKEVFSDDSIRAFDHDAHSGRFA